jgi:hypothetical protein
MPILRRARTGGLSLPPDADPIRREILRVFEKRIGSPDRIVAARLEAQRRLATAASRDRLGKAEPCRPSQAAEEKIFRKALTNSGIMSIPRFGVRKVDA